SGVGLGATLMPMIAQTLIAGYGWRIAYLVLGAFLILVTTPLIVIFLRDTPIDLNLKQANDPNSSDVVKLRLTSGFSQRQAFRQKPVWFMALIFMFTSMAVTAVVVHL